MRIVTVSLSLSQPHQQVQLQSSATFLGARRVDESDGVELYALVNPSAPTTTRNVYIQAPNDSVTGNFAAQIVGADTPTFAFIA